MPRRPRISVAESADDGLAERIVRLRDGRQVAVRVARSADASAVQQFVRGLSDGSRRNRFFAPVRELSPDQLDRVTRSRPPGELALVGETAEGTGSRIVAMAQYAVCESLDAEFAVVVDDAWQRQGLATQLLCVLTEHAASVTSSQSRRARSSSIGQLSARTRPQNVASPARADPYAIRVVKRFAAHEMAI